MGSCAVFFALLLAAVSCAGRNEKKSGWPGATAQAQVEEGNATALTYTSGTASANSAGSSAKHAPSAEVVHDDTFQLGQVPEFHISPPH